jgi:hypothetical protein
MTDPILKLSRRCSYRPAIFVLNHPGKIIVYYLAGGISSSVLGLAISRWTFKDDPGE